MHTTIGKVRSEPQHDLNGKIYGGAGVAFEEQTHFSALVSPAGKIVIFRKREAGVTLTKCKICRGQERMRWGHF